jgi:pimeloyl-ACP methyl ester carboxylesterase
VTGLPDSSETPTRTVVSPDGARIAVFSAGSGPPIILVHGATADHSTWRSSGPRLAIAHTTHALDRRGRGASGDGQAYAIEREFEDVASVVDAVAAEGGLLVDVVGHSYGGRIGLGAALLTSNLRRLVVYEGAPPAADHGYQDEGTLSRIETLVAARRHDDALATFMTEIVGMPDADLAAFRADPIWPRRAAAVSTTIRELREEVSPVASLAALAEVRQPVLQILGGDSAAPFRAATEALQDRLVDGRVVVIDGARHAAHHTHVDAFVGAIQAFLDRPDMAD